jgi:L-iditol 2-dehydrogenase
MVANTQPWEMPETMPAALFHAPGDVRYSEVPVPRPGPGELVVQVKQALTCGTDLKCYRRGHPVLLAQLPSPFGHEFSGVVADVGVGVTRFSAGDRVVCANSAPCGDCFYCQAEQMNLCEQLQLLNGAYAGYILVPAPIVARNTYPLTENMPFEIAAFTEPLAVSLRGVDGIGVKAGEHIAIMGLGPIGLLMVKVAKLRGAHVTAFARNPMKLAMAQSFGGADAVVDMADGLDVAQVVARNTPQGRGFDGVIEAIGLPHTWEAAVGLVRRGGRVHWFAGCPGDSTVTLSTKRLHYDEITLYSLFHHTPVEVRAAFDLLCTGQLDPRPLISGSYGLVDLTTALGQMEAGLGFKYQIEP